MGGQHSVVSQTSPEWVFIPLNADRWRLAASPDMGSFGASELSALGYQPDKAGARFQHSVLSYQPVGAERVLIRLTADGSARSGLLVKERGRTTGINPAARPAGLGRVSPLVPLRA